MLAKEESCRNVKRGGDNFSTIAAFELGFDLFRLFRLFRLSLTFKSQNHEGRPANPLPAGIYQA